MKGRALAYSSGDPHPLDGVTVREGTATFFAPHGRIVTDSAAVAEQYRGGAKLLSPGSKNRLQILDSRASGDIGY